MKDGTKKIGALVLLAAAVCAGGYYLWQKNKEKLEVEKAKKAELEKTSTATPGIVPDPIVKPAKPEAEILVADSVSFVNEFDTEGQNALTDQTF